jgi:hypothetical protein
MWVANKIAARRLRAVIVCRFIIGLENKCPPGLPRISGNHGFGQPLADKPASGQTAKED